jgi:hypothetical protein
MNEVPGHIRVAVLSAALVTDWTVDVVGYPRRIGLGPLVPSGDGVILLEV